MASSPRNRKAAANAVVAPEVTLADVQAATEAGSFVYTSAAFHTALVESGEVEINPEIVDEHGNIATRYIQKKVEPEMTETVTQVAAKPTFVIETGLPIPEARARKVSSGLRAGRAAVYPFEALDINQSFFVADKVGKNRTGKEFPPAIKSMASTVAAANGKYVEEIAGETRENRRGKTVAATRQLRKFKLFESERTLEDGTVEKGARIFRVALED